mgnify:FL=1
MKLLPDMQQVAHILIVDDDINILKMMEMICKRAGFECHIAASGPEAIKLVSAVPDYFDVLLIDTLMPGLHGFDTTSRIRQIPDAEHQYIVICSALATADEVVRAVESGADDVFYKPFLPRELVERLEGWTTISRMRRVWMRIPDQARFDHFYTHAAADEDIQVRVLAAEWLVYIAQTVDERDQIRELLHTWLNDVEDLMVQTAKRLLRQLE